MLSLSDSKACPMYRLRNCLPLGAFLLGLALPALGQQSPETWFARVNGFEVSGEAYDRNARDTFRRQFYHGQPPEAEVNKMLKAVGDKLIDRVLLDDQARARGIVADPAALAAEVARLDRDYAQDPDWPKHRAEAVATLTPGFEMRQRAEQLEKQVRAVAPTDAEVEAFYRANPALFTEPPKNKVSLILLRVDPSSPASAWDDARKRILDIKAKIEMGADFAKVAKEVSNDATAASGGDMGFTHQGTLSPDAEDALRWLSIGEISEPVRVLEGEAIFRLDGRQAAKLQPFDAVAERAKALLVDRKSNAQWASFLEELRAKATISIGPLFRKIMSYDPANPAATPAPDAPRP
jgi:hypothetical protein